jgi:hypothetical protein
MWWIFLFLALSFGFMFGWVVRVRLHEQNRAVGTITLTEHEDGMKTYLFDVHGDTDEVLAQSEEVLFKVLL